jgi:nitrogen fixation-related uncharacterized protein
MSPGDLSALMTLLSVLKQMGSWPFGLIIFLLVIGPWLLQFVFWRMDTRRYEHQDAARKKELQEKEDTREKELRETLRRYREDVSAIKNLYESNSRLVVATNEAFKRLEKRDDELVSVISLNTETHTILAEAIKNNQFCPVVRSKGGFPL